MTYVQVTASLFIDCVSPVKIHPPSFLNVSALSFLGKHGFLTDINPYVFKETLQGENGGKNRICCLNKRSNLLHTVWEHCPKTSEGTKEAEHASCNSDFNETTVISGTEIPIDMIITEKVKMQLLPFVPNPYSPSPFRTMAHTSNTEPKCHSRHKEWFGTEVVLRLHKKHKPSNLFFSCRTFNPYQHLLSPGAA